MENKADEEYKKIYPDLSDLTESASTQDEDSEEETGQESARYQLHRVIQPQNRSSSTHSPSSRKSNSKDTQQNYTWFALRHIIAFMMIPVLAFIYYHNFGGNVSAPTKKEWKNIVTKLQSHLREKGDKFPSQKENLWFQISSGLEGLSNNPKNPAVYLLTYDENSMHPSSCIAEIITTTANNYLLDKNGWSFLNGSLLIGSPINDPGQFIETIANTLETHKVIVVTDVQDIPAKLAQGFHFLVDQYNPKIREAVYVLTLKIPSHLKSSRPVEEAENTLRECWRELKYDLLQPLITRVTNQVLPVVAETNVINCPLVTSVTTEIYIT